MRYIFVALAAVAVFFAGRCTRPESATLAARVKTVIKWDTIRVPSPPVTETVPVIRLDTAKLALVTAQRDSLLEVLYTASSNRGTDSGDINGGHLSTAPTDSAAVIVPIEQKTYQTADYKAVVEGFRPELVYLEVYRQTRYIDRVQMTPDTRRWGLGLQAGYGLSVQNGNVKAYPYIGVGVQYSLFRW